MVSEPGFNPGTALDCHSSPSPPHIPPEKVLLQGKSFPSYSPFQVPHEPCIAPLPLDKLPTPSKHSATSSTSSTTATMDSSMLPSCPSHDQLLQAPPVQLIVDLNDPPLAAPSPTDADSMPSSTSLPTVETTNVHPMVTRSNANSSIDLWYVVGGNDVEAPPNNPENAEILKKWWITNAKAESILKRSISHGLFDHIMGYQISSGGEEVSQALVATFPSLRELTLYNMENLVEWLEVSAVFPSCFPCLENVDISICPKFTIMPSRFTHLTSLRTAKLPELEFLPELSLQNSKHIRNMYIWDCPKLEAIISSKTSEGIQRENEGRLQMQALETLEIIGYCSRLKSIIPDVRWGFTSLKFLYISDCPNLMYVPDVQGLINLKNLVIHKCEKLQSLPEGLQCLSTLEELNISDFSNALDCYPKAEGIQHLASLRSVTIIGWPKLKSLPEEIQHLDRRPKRSKYKQL
ncbi:hypothetical protein HHK36_019996 [Tetracentron sinense]|uniref:Uncharacterized protein n=1 Tax=Tetracentron sinense TaxID=13715 RepID=A0A835D7N1_TETSI|nr:hypothetical protein HHK36_019996 [Tetracentron sinense]